ncbi:MAG: hypothetical protein M1830_000679 [Pleopsidium flavum]|nr:MAG: hypothetical protein M1830_000679 [Pleopsidium flavum]
MAAANVSETSSSRISSSSPVTLLTGAVRLTSTLLNGTAVANATATTNVTSSTSSSAQPTNTQPCNNYPELCTRKYSNITEVGAHNSPFVRPGSAASNQELGVIAQLNDGIRMLQGQTHMVNNTLYYCHTSCDLLNAGTVESYLRTVTSWIQNHPYDVVTILIGNGDFVEVGNYTTPIENSGLSRYAYTPSQIPLAIDDWPTLSELILTGKRAVIFMDYKANQTAVPYILDEFSQMWETPFSPTDRRFPCTVQRPPGIKNTQAGERLYMANHNLNIEITLAGISLLVPNTVLLNETNNVTGFGSLGLMANDCAEAHPKPPNFLLVDYYNIDNGTVFEVAAQHNNVTYTRPCCGLVPSAAERVMLSVEMFGFCVLTAVAFLTVM